MKKIPMGNGHFNNALRKLSLVNAEILYLPGKTITTNKEYPHCVTVKTKEDISKILTDDHSAVLIRISLKHGLTGISDVFEGDFAKIKNIKDGEFKPGPKFAVHS